MASTLTVALPKGVLLQASIRLFQNLGLDFSAFLDEGNRQLQIESPQGQARALLVRAQDVPVYVEYGQAQLGIVGYDVLREKKPQVADLADLGFGACRMSVAVRERDYRRNRYRNVLDLPPHCRVASKFVTCACDCFERLDLPVEIVPLSGSVELGAITGMAEAIVDLVSTGRTLRENQLIETDDGPLFQSTAHLIAHPLSYRLNRGNLAPYVRHLQASAAEAAPAQG